MLLLLFFLPFIVRKHILALKKHRDETQQWLRGFQTNLQESFHSGSDDIDIKNFFIAIDENEERYHQKYFDSFFKLNT